MIEVTLDYQYEKIPNNKRVDDIPFGQVFSGYIHRHFAIYLATSEGVFYLANPQLEGCELEADTPLFDSVVATDYDGGGVAEIVSYYKPLTTELIVKYRIDC
jgi:hypothetical protein